MCRQRSRHEVDQSKDQEYQHKQKSPRTNKVGKFYEDEVNLEAM